MLPIILFSLGCVISALVYYVVNYYKKCLVFNSIDGIKIKKLTAPLKMVELYSVEKEKVDPIYIKFFGINIPFFGGTCNKEHLVMKKILSDDVSLVNYTYCDDTVFSVTYLNNEEDLRQFCDENRIDMKKHLLKLPLMAKTCDITRHLHCSSIGDSCYLSTSLATLIACRTAGKICMYGFLAFISWIVFLLAVAHF